MEVQYWRFSSERFALAACNSAGLGSPASLTKRGTIQWVGTIYYGGKFDHAANRLTEPPKAYFGYHVNYKGPLVKSLEQYRVFPKSPTFAFL